MIGSPVAKRYATALYELAEEKKAVDKVDSDLSDLAGSWEASEELRRVFMNPSFGIEAKRQLAAALADKAGAHPIVKNTMQMLSDRRRLEHLPEISEVFTRISERRSGKVRAEIVTATALPEAYYTQLQSTLKQATGKEVLLVRREDPTLIGGVVTTIGGRVFDGSLKNRLRELRSQLLASTDPAALAQD
ncbi:MAG TPA: ATP synthase F1 subunit delta [Sandaracinaceae bacterium LLY-WYZ-13_1]|nr:ATP synthase F1 subunit delta [Sandaracinaceae bacterium LLY-WYZ-13_1]